MNELLTIRAKLVKRLKELDPQEPDFEPVLEQLGTIDEQIRKEKLFQMTKPSSKLRGVSPDVLVNAGTNLIGMGMVLHFERVGVITSKAFGLIKKLK